MKSDTRFEQAVARFERAHEEDPRTLVIDGVSTTWSTHYHRRLLYWLRSFDAQASVTLRLAAACQHIRRWQIPRADYAAGRRGYRRWRSDLAALHAKIAREVLETVGYEEETIARVESLLRKKRLGRDPDVQLFEDAICMVFFENEFVTLAQKHDDEKMVDILRRTWAKMSEVGRKAALDLAKDLPRRERELVETATT